MWQVLASGELPGDLILVSVCELFEVHWVLVSVWQVWVSAELPSVHRVWTLWTEKTARQLPGGIHCVIWQKQWWQLLQVLTGLSQCQEFQPPLGWIGNKHAYFPTYWTEAVGFAIWTKNDQSCGLYQTVLNTTSGVNFASQSKWKLFKLQGLVAELTGSNCSCCRLHQSNAFVGLAVHHSVVVVLN